MLNFTETVFYFSY